MDEFPQLAEPKTLAELDRVIETRNANFLSAETWLPRPDSEQYKKLFITRDQVLRELRRVVEDEPASPGPVRTFLGGVGLIVRRGFDDAITGAGLALLRSVAPPSRRAA